MYDVFVLYHQPRDGAAFDAHYRSVHVPLVEALPLLREFTWGRTAEPEDPVYLVARMTYDSATDAQASMSSEAGRAAVADLERFATAGAQILNSERAGTWTAGPR